MQLRYYREVIFNDSTEIITGGIHPSYELLYLDSGKFRLKWLGEIYDIKPKSLILITPNTPHDLMILSQKAKFWFMELTEIEEEPLFPVMQDILFWNRLQCNMDHQFKLPKILQICIDGVSHLLDRKLPKQPYEEEHLLMDVRKILLIIRGELERYKKKQKSGDPVLILPGFTLMKDVIKTLVLHLESDYKQNVTLQTLSDIANFQATYLIKKFKEETGFTPIEYLHELRMKAAKNYLTTTGMTIQQIAEEVGYGNIHHFSGAFKRKIGKSPSIWRQEMQLQ